MTPGGAGSRVIVEVDEAGEVRIAVEGVAGPRCEALTAELEEHLGRVREGSRRRTRDWYRSTIRQAEDQPQGS